MIFLKVIEFYKGLNRKMCHLDLGNPVVTKRTVLYSREKMIIGKASLSVVFYFDALIELFPALFDSIEVEVI